MKNELILASLALIFATGCAPAILKEVNSYEKIKTCDGKEMKINFFVRDPSDNPDEDIFTKELIVKIRIFKSKYGALILWLYYKATNLPDKRNLPEYRPDKITVETKSTIKKISETEFPQVWREFMTPINLTFIENCLFN